MVRQTRGVNFFARGAGLVIIELISPYHLLKSMTNQSEISLNLKKYLTGYSASLSRQDFFSRQSAHARSIRG